MNEPETHNQGFNLPAPANGAGGANTSPNAETPQSQAPETSLSAPEQAGSGTSMPASAASSMPSAPQPLATSSSPAPTGGASISVPTPATAEDADIIEKEWVEKAKHIVEMSRSDPHQQNKDINKFKADYIKKRYNKTIKVSEE